jgi:hypothetical protein
MSAEVLRQAADLMRKRASTATPGLWQAGQDVDSGEHFIYDERWTELAQVAEWSRWLGNPEHIASWSPLVALAVADWLDNQADTTCDCGVDESALLVANAYLGNPAN